MRSSRALCMLAILLTGSSALAQDQPPSQKPTADRSAALVGNWEGTLSIPPGLELQVIFKITAQPGAEPKATLDVPDQGASGIAVSKLSVEGDEIVITIKSIAAEFRGKRDRDPATLHGKWKQGSISLPLALKKVETISQRRRPQTPKPPFPYRVEEVRYPSSTGGVSLAGTLTLPEGAGPFPAVILITGSGPQDRDETILGHKPFLVLADFLTRKGIAVLRFDDRGIGKSSGLFALATTAEFADDVQGGLAFLKKRPEINGKRIGLVGHSEGGIIAPMVAARAPGDVAFVVLMAGTGFPGAAILETQQRDVLRAAGEDDAGIKAATSLLQKLLPIVQAENDPKTRDQKLRAEVKSWLESLPEAKRKEAAEKDLASTVVRQLGLPWMRYFLVHDPRADLAKVKCPVLALGGELDLQVACRENLAEIEKALKNAGNTRVTTRAFPGLNHLFQTCKTGAVSEYAAIEETISPAVLETIAGWIKATLEMR